MLKSGADIMRDQKTAALALVLTLLSTSALAVDRSPIEKSNNVFWLSAGVNNLVHKDPNLSGTPLSTSEHGWMPSFEAGASMMGETGYFLSAIGDVTVGSSTYRGFDSGFNSVEGNTDNLLFSFKAQAGWDISPFETVAIIPYVEGDYHYWKRDTEGELEYTHFAALGGLRLQYAVTDATVISAYGAYGSILSANVTANTGLEEEPEEKPIYRLGTKMAYSPAISPRYEYFVTSDYTSFDYGESDTYPTTSYTHQFVTRVGLGYRFR